MNARFPVSRSFPKTSAFEKAALILKAPPIIGKYFSLRTGVFSPVKTAIPAAIFTNRNFHKTLGLGKPALDLSFIVLPAIKEGD
jgi:hypothetical protein